MKIALQGTIIDTENIYKISEINKDTGGHIKFNFKITLFNDIKITVDILSNCYLDPYKYTDGVVARIGLDSAIEHYGSYDNARLAVETSVIYNTQLRKLINLRDKLITYWSNNQTHIPKLEL